MTRRLLCGRLESIFLQSYAYEVINQHKLPRLQKRTSLATAESISSTRVLPFNEALEIVDYDIVIYTHGLPVSFIEGISNYHNWQPLLS